jgi:chaperonin GroEL
VTYGPAGKTVFLERSSGVLATKDGATVVREISLSDPCENLGASILKEPCLAMSDAVGDGTTTTAILAANILRTCARFITGGYQPIELVRGLREASEVVTDLLREMAIEVVTEAEIRAVAMIASNGDEEISDLLTQGCMAVGRDGSISIEDGRGTQSELIIRDGMDFDSGFTHYHLSPEGGRLFLEQPMVALFTRGLFTFRDVRSVAETASQWPHRPLLIIAPTVEGEALAAWALNPKIRQSQVWTAVSAPGYGPDQRAYLEDIAALSGATLVDTDAGMDHTEFQGEWFGNLVQTATIEKDKTNLVGYDTGNEDLERYIESLKTRLRKSTSNYDKDRIRERIAKLDGGFCVLRVGGVTESTLKERRARIEDALGSLRAALEHGILPGAGSALQAASEWLTERGYEDGGVGKGQMALARALREPLRVLVENAGLSASVMEHKVWNARKDAGFDPWVGVDLTTGGVRMLHGDPLVIDAARVLVDAIRYAVSATSTLVMTELAVVRRKSK